MDSLVYVYGVDMNADDPLTYQLRATSYVQVAHAAPLVHCLR